MMWCIGQEFKKIRRTKVMLFLILIIIPVLLYLSISAIHKYEPSDGMFLFVEYVFENFAYMLPVFYISAMVMTALLFAKEIEDRTMMYVLIRPISYRKLFFSKIIVILGCSFIIELLFFVLTMIIGRMFFDVVPFPCDTDVLTSFIKTIVIFLTIFIGIVFSVGICLIMSMLLKDFVGSVVVSTVLFMIVSYPLYINGNYYSLCTFQPVGYDTSWPLNELLKNRLDLLLVNSIVIIILFSLGYFLFLRNKSKN